MASASADDSAARRRAILRWTVALASCLLLAGLCLSHPFFRARRAHDRADRVIAIMGRQPDLAEEGRLRESRELGEAEDVLNEVDALLDPASGLSAEYRDRIARLWLLHSVLVMERTRASRGGRTQVDAPTPGED